MHFLALCFIISPFESGGHQYSADMMAKSPRFNPTTSCQMSTTNCGTKALRITHARTHTEIRTHIQTQMSQWTYLTSKDAHAACHVERLMK